MVVGTKVVICKIGQGNTEVGKILFPRHSNLDQEDFISMTLAQGVDMATDMDQ